MSNTVEWLHKSLKDKNIPTEDILTELYHRVQLEELPLIIYTQNGKWNVTLDERSAGKGKYDGFHFHKPFGTLISATAWARKQFGTGGDVNIDVVNGVVRPMADG